jgi:hypothetical protein
MSTDYRAELQRLVKAYDEHGGRWPDEGVQALHNAVEAARTTLAQPESDEVTPAEIYRLIEEVDQKGLARPGLVRAALARWGRPAIQPVPVAERLPGPGKKVIAYYLNALGNSRTILAEWVPAKTKADDGLADDDFAEYDEESDEYCWPEGWYEVIENWDDYGAVFVNEGEITHWRPLPPGPHNALPVPGAEVAPADRGSESSLAEFNDGGMPLG